MQKISAYDLSEPLAKEMSDARVASQVPDD
jgi:hypothetical protein